MLKADLIFVTQDYCLNSQVWYNLFPTQAALQTFRSKSGQREQVIFWKNKIIVRGRLCGCDMTLLSNFCKKGPKVTRFPYGLLQ